MDPLMIIVTALLMVIGLLGVFIPVIPGLFLIVGAGFLYGWATDFGLIGSVVLGVMIVVAILGTAAGYVMPHKRMVETGAPRSTILAGLILGVAGFFLSPIIGFLIGAIMGVLLAEKSRTGDWSTARSSTRTLLVGFGVGKLFELIGGLAMVGLWVGWVFSQ